MQRLPHSPSVMGQLLPGGDGALSVDANRAHALHAEYASVAVGFAAVVDEACTTTTASSICHSFILNPVQIATLKTY